MNLKQKIEEWEKTRRWAIPPEWQSNHALANDEYSSFMQALKEAAEIMDKIGLEENEVNATLKPTESDVELKILNAYLKDFWSAPKRWLKKWGLE